jgi:hypothetical protein
VNLEVGCGLAGLYIPKLSQALWRGADNLATVLMIVDTPDAFLVTCHGQDRLRLGHIPYLNSFVMRSRDNFSVLLWIDCDGVN